ncbi:alpha/beta hydrolase [Amycolatopsis sp. NPDC059657]|uniref:alpha/beta hydrolase n=1 Tax=Amycolatopsis sp. NPDC059657 TaxID=3346899 RepID=UPI003670D661
MRKRLMALGMCALILASTLGATSANAAPALDWQPCQGLPAPLECATLTVPLDYRNPGGAKLDVAVSRLKSTNPQARRGALLLNPGGPGGSGLDLPLAIAQLSPASLTDAYDLIGFDPRGTGKSSPVTCALTPEQLDQSKVIPYPAPNGDIAENVAYAKQVAKQCREHSGKVLPFITTQNTARDMDGIRAALGEKKISYLGYSYGSYLGAVYTTMFPAQSDRIVLDSVVDPREVWRTVWQQWGPSNEERFEDFAKWAALRDPSYGLGATPAAVRATYLNLAAKLDKAPLGSYTGNIFRGQVRGALYDDHNFAIMAKQIQGLLGGQAPPPPSGPPGDEGQSSLATLWGVACDDATWPGSIAQHQRDVLVYKQRYPITAGMPSNVWPCAFWPTKPIEPPLRIGDRGPSNVLLTQNQRDPATPLVGAKAMRAALGDRARLVTADAGGHGAYLFQENACLTNTATTFLVNGRLPARDIRCGTELSKRADDPARDRIVQDIQSKQFPL